VEGYLMAPVRYPHRATTRLEPLEPLNGPHLHDRIYTDILIAGATYSRATAKEHKAGTDLLGTLMEIHQDYSDEAGPFGDPFGEYLECNNQTSERAGQFFTPLSVVDTMVETTFADLDLQGDPVTICDPAAGTGRFMLRTARHFAQKNRGALNFLFTNVDLDRRAFIYCVANAILTGIPAFHLWGNSLKVEIFDAFATLPLSQGFALWERLPPTTAKRLLVMAANSRPAEKPVPKETIQISLGGEPA
jgi:hypothetical protein